MIRAKNLWVFDSKRLLILHSLYNCHNSLCGCDLIDKLKIPKNLLSHHINTLHAHGLITEKKCGRKRNYRLNGKKLPQIKRVLQAVELIK